MDQPNGSERCRSTMLALAAAYVDTCGFIGLFGLFTAHVTGNFVLIGAELVNRHVDILMKSLALPAFVVSVLMSAQAEVMMRHRGIAATSWLLACESLLLAVAALVPYWTALPQRPDDVASIVVGLLLIVALGVQNTLMRTSLAGPVQTTVMTGNVTQLTIDLLAVSTGRGDDVTRSRITRSWPAVAAFALGSALGAAGYAWVRFNSLWLAVVLVAAGAWLCAREPSPAPDRRHVKPA